MAPASRGGLLSAAIEAIAQRDPQRVALAGGGETRTYGQLAELIPAGRADSTPPPNTRLVSARVADAEAVLADCLRGDSTLLLDARTTAGERARVEAVFEREAPQEGDPAVIGLCTSGSSGLPKVVALDWPSVQENADSFASAAGFAADDVIWCTTPLAHLFCFGAGLLAGLLKGATVLFSDGMLEPEEFAHIARTERPTVLLSVPFLFNRYLDGLEREPDLVGEWSLRRCIAAGEPVHPTLIDRWQRLAGVKLQAHYGLTEGGHVTLAGGGAEDGVGAPLPDVELRIGDDSVIHVRRKAPQRPYRILGQPPLPDGWCDSGDLGHLDQRGNLHVTGRADRRINFGGKNVDPEEIEQALAGCRGVVDAAVVGIAAGDGEQRIAAFIQVDGEIAVSDGEIRVELAKALSPYKLPRHFVRVESIPRTLTGKVRFGELIPRLPDSDPPAGRDDILEMVRAVAAAVVLGHETAEALDPDVAFKDLGFDSLAAVELRNRLGEVTGMRLPTTLAFDHPTPRSLAAFLATGARSGSGASRPHTGGGAGTEEPIAIVGMSCRYPGGVGSPQAFWELLSGDGEGISAFPTDRGWDLEHLFHPDPDHTGTSYAREGGFLADAAEFDAEFFSISPREALAMDPQQRLLLEAAWEALEDAGLDPGALAGSATGVFAGVMRQDYWQVGSSVPGLEHFQGVGGAGSVVSGRIAYALDFQGPAVTVDTACSSSLVAMHLACQALRSGECEMALTGGATVMATPWPFIEFSRQRALAPDGRCKSFDAAADGTGFSEGVGLLVLEPLSEARRNGHEPIALIRGTATNQDGASNGLTAPNGPSQERVIRQALANAGLSPSEVDAVEAHGTGTVLGDPIEANALLATYGQDRGEAGPLRLGSVKSNIGHAQAAAGVAGVIKMALAMRNGLLPKSLHLDQPTPHVDWEAGEVELLSEAQPWEANGRPRRAGVSSFGISGTNAHLILEEAAPTTAPEPASLPATPLLLSAKGEAALRESAARLATHMRTHPELGEAQIAAALAPRARLSHRAVAIGSGREELLGGLDALATGEPHGAVSRGRASAGKLAFLLSGQGSQRLGMSRELSAAFPVFAEAFDGACAALDPHLGRPLKDVLFAAEGSPEAALLDRTEFTQPALFALHVSLFRLLGSLGVTPDYMLGHSVGEISAAHLAGALSLPEAAGFIALRARLMGELPEGGAMAAVRAGEEEVEQSLAEFAGRLCIAAVNAPGSVVVSGEREALAQWREALAAEGGESRELRVSHAFHSPLMEPMLATLAQAAAELELKAPQIPVISNLSGTELSAEQLASPAYWAEHARQAVRFADGVSFLAGEGVGRFLELGPDPVLAAFAEETLQEGSPALFAAALNRRRPEPQALLLALGSLHAEGVPVDWAELLGARAAPPQLPTYPFQRRRYWLAGGSSSGGEAAAIGQSTTGHPLLGAAVSLPGEEGEEWLLTGRLSLQSQPWLADHSALEATLFPASGFFELALRAAEQAGAEVVEELAIAAPLALPEQGAVQVQVSARAEQGEEGLALQIRSRREGDEGEWTVNASGRLGASAAPEPAALAQWPPAAAEPLAVDSLYEEAAELGLDYGPAFQGVRAAWRRGEELFAEVALGPEQAAEAERFAIHPALLDAALHSELLRGDSTEQAQVPFALTGLRLHAAGASSLRVRLAPAGGGPSFELLLADASGAPVARAEAIELRPLSAAGLGARQGSGSLLALTWEGLELAAGAAEPARPIECRPDPQLDPPSAAQALCAEVLAHLQEAISAEGAPPGERLAFLTTGALAAGEGEAPDPAAAAVWGLLRAAQAEHPGRFLLIDGDGSEASAAALEAALSTQGEPQLALREGSALVPRLRAAAGADSEPRPLDPEKAVLITGGSGALGSLFARHLAREHGVAHLVLASRRGAQAPGAEELRAELAELGAEAELVACDCADPDQMGELVGQIAGERRLGAVLHCAGLTDDGVIEGLDPERLRATLAPKADAAWHLHELTREIEGCELILFSSVAATIQSPGQGNYAAANAFLDALAQRRRAEGLPALSLGWGAWERESALTADLSEADRARIARAGIAALADGEGLELFERARRQGAPQLVAARLDTAALRAGARAGTLAPLLSRLIRATPRRAGSAGALAERLAAAAPAEREGLVLELVRESVAAVLGHETPEALDPDVAFKDLGFDSLVAVELRNRLGTASGMRLPATLAFDHPNATAVAAFLRAQLAGSASAATVTAARALEEPIAIVGMSCRYPGGVGSPQAFWELLSGDGEGISAFPTDRGWDLEHLFHPDPDHTGTSYAREGGFLADAAEFDAEFFAISPREALAMDPQQRLLLEAAWEALEDAGLDPAALAGSSTGVFAGVMHHDYGGRAAGLVDAEGYQGVAGAASVLTGRVAYALDLQGSAVTVDTACSSSLVAMHLACQALRSGECEMALAGGVTVMDSPDQFIEFSRQRGLAPDGRCKSFSATADGTSWSEGVGLLVLEPLSRAQEQGHEPIALIRGTATNQDGASNGLTAPNGPSQERVIRQALANAGLSPSEVDAVEAHGTGTVLGDPIEANALLATYGQDRGEAGPLRLGSVKSNIGHAQAAAGVAGVIKMALAMRNGLLPKSLHLDQPTPHVDWEAGEVELLSEAQPWEANGRPRRAGVSSFGISGTNAHLILEEAAPTTAPEPASLPATPLLLSAKGEAALRESAARLATHMRTHPELGEAQIAAALAPRARLSHRAVAIGSGREELLGGLDALATGEPHGAVSRGRASAGKLAFLLSGQGSQRLGMSRELSAAFPVFAEAFDGACAALDPHLGRPLKDVLFAAEGSPEAALLDRTEFTQPALFALHVSLFRLLGSLGVTPDYMLGHSVGEISAAHLAGALSLPEAAGFIALRARLMGELPEGGAMAAVRAGEEEVEQSLAEFAGRLCIAAVNAPGSVVVSGEREALAQWREALAAEGGESRELRVSHAFHSPLMEPMLATLAQAAAELELKAPQIPVISNLSGTELSAEQLASPAYWAEHARQAVRFADGVSFLAGEGVGRFLELGPDPVLAAFAEETLQEGSPALFAAALNRRRPEPQALLLALGSLHAEGVPVDWAELLGARAAPPQLPTYPFQRRRYWLAGGSSSGGEAAAIGQSTTGHPLLGAAVSLPGEEGEEWLLTGRLSLQSQPWLADHSALEATLFPASGFFELALRAAEQAGAEVVEELAIAAPLALPEQGAVQVQVSARAEQGEEGLALQIRSRREGDEGEWTVNASGRLGASAAPEPAALAQWPPAAAEPLAVDSLYEEAAELGLDYGPAFQGVRAAWRRGEELFAEVALGPEQAAEAERFAIHPALLDAALHSELLRGDSTEQAQVPFALTGLRLHAAGASSLRVRLAPAGGGPSFELLLADASGAPVARAEAIELRPLSAAGLGARQGSGSLLALTWEGLELAAGAAEPARPIECRPDPQLDPPSAAQALCAEVLAHLQEAISAEGAPPGERLAFLTTGALAAGEGEAPDPAAAAVWGLLRAAQAEHPGRFLLIDGDGSEASAAALEAALSTQGEPQLALREGSALVPRLRAAAGADSEPRPLDPEKAVLITGGSGALGSLFARHLAREHGVAHLVLASRRGAQAPGAEELRAELAELGAEAELVACDCADPDQMGELVGQIAGERRLGAVLHCAGLTDDGVIEGLDPERLRATLAPKADAAWHLHELTREIEGCELILFSSVAATIQSPGQGNYAAANAFLDALAQRRRAEGLPALSLGWGAWERESALTADLSEADRARIARAGIAALADGEGLELFERARRQGAPQLVAARLDTAALRAGARAGTLAPLLSRLIRATPRRAGSAGALAERLAAAAPAEREGLVLELVRESVAAVLGHETPEALDPDVAFKDLGFDSLVAVELRNRLGTASGMRLPATLAFDHPNATAVAAFLRAQLAGSASAATVTAARALEEPIAIVGMSCRYPGGVGSPQAFWELLSGDGEGISAFPTDRGWDLEHLFHPDPDHTGTSYAREGGFLADAAEFDAEFFAISPREALAMDPQQRLLLEAAWEALEDAGLDPAALAGSSTGVFAGAMHHDYGQSGGSTAQSATALGSVIPGRIAYSFGLEGPAVTVDTACSSSLVAMHLACQALRSGECEMALAGGVTVMAAPTIFAAGDYQMALAADGRCKSFDAAADGTGFSEGAGLLVLEPLSEAKRKGHEPIALIRGTATNQDGASNGLTAPNGPSQERVIRQALANAGLSPSEVDAVEAHGTGTVLGDPIEANALLATYGQDRGEAGPLRLGSVKSNIGHAQAAAGVAGVIKMALAMRNGLLPKSLHLDQPTPHVDWEAGEVELLSEAQPWEANGRPRRAGVSSFGFSGTNAHVVLEEAPPAEATGGGGPREDEGPGQEQGPSPSSVPLLLSAKGEAALRQSAARLATHMRTHPELGEAQIAAALAPRARLSHRAVAIGSGREELLAGLDALATGEPHPGLVQGRAGAGKLAFVFGGQGAQWQGMGRALLDESTVFAAEVRACEQALSPYVDFSVEEVLRGGPEEAGKWDVTVVQPALFTMMVSLAALWRAHGVEPAATVGHSQGEIAAACVAGALSLEDAARVVALRSRAITEVIGRGGMVALRLSPERALERIEPWGGRLELAVVNSPVSTVVGGEPAAVEELVEACEAEGIRAKNLGLGGAGHTSHVETIRERVLSELIPIEPREGSVPFYSSMTGGPLDGRELTAEYWYRSAREPVRFADAIGAFIRSGFDSFVEVSVHPALTVAIEETAAEVAAPGAAVTATGSLRRHEGGTECFMAALAEAHVGGVEVDWRDLLDRRGAKRVGLPPYPFQRRRYWPEAGGGDAGDPAAVGQSATDHSLLGAAVAVPGGEQRWLLTGRLSPQDQAWLADHAVLGTPLVPGSAFVELAFEAGKQAGVEHLEELTLEMPLVLSEHGAVQIRVGVEDPDAEGRRQLAIHSRVEGAEGEWVRNASGVLGAMGPSDGMTLDEWPPAGAEPVPIATLYEELAAQGVDYGPAFQGVRAAWRRGEELFAEVELDEEQRQQAGGFAIHPALLDSAFQAGSLAGERDEGPHAPYALQGVCLHQRGASVLRVRLARVGRAEVRIEAFDAAHNPVLAVESLVARPFEPASVRGALAANALFVPGWVELPRPEAGCEQPARRFECVATPDLAPPAAARALCAEVLAELQAAISGDGERVGERVAFITRGAVAPTKGERPDPAAAAVWGLVGSAQAEHPGRFILVDTDASEASAAALDPVLASEAEPQIALREGKALAPRLTQAPQPEIEPRPLDPERPVLVTGASGEIGRLLSRHLVSAHGVRRLVLASRRGREAPGAEEAIAELAELGAEADVVACDVAERAQLEALLDSIQAERPLAAVFHAAALADDGTITSLDAGRIATAMAPKADAAWHLHELTRENEGCELVLFSSIAGCLQSPGQGNYAAANAFLDALAQRRHAEGLAGTSLAWGLWATGAATGANLARIGRAGVVEMTPQRGLELLDRGRALAGTAPFVVAAELDLPALRGAALEGSIPPLLRGLVQVPSRRAEPAAPLAKRLGNVPADEREGVLLDLVLAQVASVLGHDSGASVDATVSFRDLGFDSLSAVDLRNRLTQASGLRLPATLAFDHPTASGVARFLLSELETGDAPSSDTDRKLDSIASILESVPAEEMGRARTRLRGMLAHLGAAGREDRAADLDLDAAGDEELLELIDAELGGRR